MAKYASKTDCSLVLGVLEGFTV